MDKEELEAFAERPVSVLDAGEYTLRIIEVQISDDELSLQPFCIVVDGDSAGEKACPETYDFHEGGENADAIQNMAAWGVTQKELLSTDGDVKSLGALLEGRLGRVSLEQQMNDDGELVNTHTAGAITPLEG